MTYTKRQDKQYKPPIWHIFIPPLMHADQPEELLYFLYAGRQTKNKSHQATDVYGHLTPRVEKWQRYGRKRESCGVKASIVHRLQQAADTVS